MPGYPIEKRGNCRPKEENYDLMSLVIIRLGDENYRSEERSILDFLTMIFYPHKEGFRKKIARYIDVEEVLQELYEEGDDMGGLEEIYYCDGVVAGRKEGHREGRKEGRREGNEDATRMIVGNMLKRNMPIEDICALAECSREFVERVRKEIL